MAEPAPALFDPLPGLSDVAIVAGNYRAHWRWLREPRASRPRRGLREHVAVRRRASVPHSTALTEGIQERPSQICQLNVPFSAARAHGLRRFLAAALVPEDAASMWLAANKGRVVALVQSEADADARRQLDALCAVIIRIGTQPT